MQPVQQVICRANYLEVCAKAKTEIIETLTWGQRGLLQIDLPSQRLEERNNLRRQFEKDLAILVSEQPIIEIHMLVKTVGLSYVTGYQLH